MRARFFLKSTYVEKQSIKHPLEHLARRFTSWAGSPWAFLIAAGLTLLWVMSGPFFRFSTAWQLIINTLSSVVTFLMVFLLQRSQNKHSIAMQLKLNEIIAALQNASNRLINIEDLSEKEIIALQKRHQDIASKIQSSAQSQDMAVDTSHIKNPKEHGE